MFDRAQELSFDEWKATYENARDGTFAHVEEEEQESGEESTQQQTATSGDSSPRRLSEREKREVYDFHKENPQVHTVAALSQKYQTSVKTVRALLILQKLVREAEAAGEINPPQLDAEPEYITTWDDWQEYMGTLDEKQRNQLQDGPIGRMKRAEDFEYFGAPPTEQEEVKTTDPKSDGYDEYPTFASEKQMEKIRKRQEMNKTLSHVEPPRKTIAPRLLDKEYGKSTNPDHRYKFKTLFQDISEASSKEERFKIMGILDHDGTFRPPTETELGHRVKRLTPAKLKASVKREIMTQKKHRLF